MIGKLAQQSKLRLREAELDASPQDNTLLPLQLDFTKDLGGRRR